MWFTKRLKKYDAEKSMFEIGKRKENSRNDYGYVAAHALWIWVIAAIWFGVCQIREIVAQEWDKPALDGWNCEE